MSKIYNQQIYFDDKANAITELLEIGGKHEVKYSASSELSFTHKGRTGKLPFGFEIEGKTIQQAFANLPEAYKAAHEKASMELRAQIAAADAPQLVDGAGLPLARKPA